jgi:hypothetical protein
MGAEKHAIELSVLGDQPVNPGNIVHSGLANQAILLRKIGGKFEDRTLLSYLSLRSGQPSRIYTLPTAALTNKDLQVTILCAIGRYSKYLTSLVIIHK